jgi:hypothetical protein
MKNIRHIKIFFSVMPAWIAGIQAHRMCPETSMSIWIPALHAGMTESRGVPTLTEFRHPFFEAVTRMLLSTDTVARRARIGTLPASSLMCSRPARNRTELDTLILELDWLRLNYDPGSAQRRQGADKAKLA